MERFQAHRSFFASLITAVAGGPAQEGRLAGAFASTPRERFLGEGLWKVPTAIGYVEMLTDDLSQRRRPPKTSSAPACRAGGRRCPAGVSRHE
jgi:hypothetical protein